MENTYFLLGICHCPYGVPGPAKESWVGKIYLTIALFPYDTAKEWRKKTKPFINFHFAFCNQTGMECAAMCLGQQRRSFGSGIFLFYQVFRAPGVEHCLLHPLLKDILKSLVTALRVRFSVRCSSVEVFQFSTYLSKYLKWEKDIFIIVSRKISSWSS